MAKTQIIKPNMELPAFLRDGPVEGVDELREYMIIPRLKIVQSMSKELRAAGHAEGDVVLLPNGTSLHINGKEPLLVVPVYFYPEWLAVHDLKLRGKVPMVKYSTRDPNDPFVLKCRDREQWQEDDAEHKGMKITNMETLNYVVAIGTASGPFTEAAVMTFAKSNHSFGRRWANLIRARNASIHAGIYEVTTQPRTNEQGAWMGWLVNNPSSSPWVDAETYERLTSLRENIRSHFASGTVTVIHDDEEGATVAASNEM